MKIFTSIIVVPFLLSGLLLSGCARKNDTPEAVKQGVIRDLAGKFDMTKMDVIVDSVSFQDNDADATVTFVPKGGTASEGMTMRYGMERHSDGLWYIKSRSSGTGTPGAPGASGALPAGHPAVAAPTSDMEPPVGAPTASGSSFNLPPGHPELGQ